MEEKKNTEILTNESQENIVPPKKKRGRKPKSYYNELKKKGKK
jgi:hypothetical protein